MVRYDPNRDKIDLVFFWCFFGATPAEQTHTYQSKQTILVILKTLTGQLHTSVEGIHTLRLFHNNLRKSSKPLVQPEVLDFLVTIQRTWQQYSEKT